MVSPPAFVNGRVQIVKEQGTAGFLEQYQDPVKNGQTAQMLGCDNACGILESGTYRTPWRTVLRARATVAQMAAVKPTTLKLGSKPEATTTPSTTGMSAAYTDGASRLPITMAAIAAVKNGVVDPIACERARCQGMLLLWAPPLERCSQHTVRDDHQQLWQRCSWCCIPGGRPARNIISKCIPGSMVQRRRAWLKETGMKRRDRLASTMARQKTSASADTWTMPATQCAAK